MTAVDSSGLVDGSTPNITFESGHHSYAEEDESGQSALIDAAFALLDGEAGSHPTDLPSALEMFDVVLAGYVSALERRPVDLPFRPPDHLLATLRGVLSDPGRT